jgi:hypothetical protein
VISLLHPSARPDKWRATCDAWLNAADYREDVQYVLCADARWGFQALSVPGILCWNQGRKCWVDSVNTAAQHSSGDILIVIADDLFPFEHWDSQLISALDEIGPPSKPFAVEVSTGTPEEHERALLAMPIVSRGLYEKWGFLLYPGYESMFADNDIFEHAQQEHLLIDARHLKFEHRHPLFEADAEWDPVYEHQNRGEAFEFGARLLEIRRETHFGEAFKPQIVSLPPKQTLACILPGEWFHQAVFGAWIGIQTELERRYNLHVQLGNSSNVYALRQSAADAILKAEPKPDLILWADNDQLLSWEGIERLLKDLADHPELSGIVGWTWKEIPNQTEALISCSSDRGPISWKELSEARQDLVPISDSGFPLVLMRREALELAGPRAFMPVFDPAYTWGMSGEDVAFFVNAHKAGLKFAVDRRVMVPHLKLMSAGPVLRAVSQVA